VLVDPAQLLAALRLPLTSQVDVEPSGLASDAPEEVVISTPDGGQMTALVRRSREDDLAQNNIAVLERLNASKYPYAPGLLAIVEGAAVEQEPPGIRALGLVPPDGSCEAAIDALAALHALPLREGLRWGLMPVDMFPDQDVPLHRLGFTAAERDVARPLFSAAREDLLASPFGFSHGNPVATNVVLSPGAAQLVNFEQAGFGPQFLDVVAFLLTVGLYGEQRRDLALRYARARELEPEFTADLVDLLGIPWGISVQLVLPRRLIESYGDELAVSAIRTMAGRIDDGIREPAGRHPVATDIRAALWR
jgi:hypothetical protein